MLCYYVRLQTPEDFIDPGKGNSLLLTTYKHIKCAISTDSQESEGQLLIMELIMKIPIKTYTGNELRHRTIMEKIWQD